MSKFLLREFKNSEQDGEGFNSSDYGYRFFEVTDYKNKRLSAGINDDQVTISIFGSRNKHRNCKNNSRFIWNHCI